ncbi:MAG: hypothetical protein WCL23_02385 [Candidatus Moraniibacteriota bacterium]
MKRMWKIRSVVVTFGVVMLMSALFFVVRNEIRKASAANVGTGQNATTVPKTTVAPKKAAVPRASRQTRSS